MRRLDEAGVLARSTRNTAKLPTLLCALRAGQVHGLGWRFGPRCETTECHIYNYNVFVFIEVDIGAALQNPQLLRKTRALLVRRGKGSFSRGM